MQFVEALIRKKFAVSDVVLNYIGPVIVVLSSGLIWRL